MIDDVRSAIPASALNEDDDDDEDDDDIVGETRDDERTGTRYNVSSTPSMCNMQRSLNSHRQYAWFHVIFAIGAMYVAMLLTDWYAISIVQGDIFVHAVSTGML